MYIPQIVYVTKITKKTHKIQPHFIHEKREYYIMSKQL